MLRKSSSMVPSMMSAPITATTCPEASFTRYVIGTAMDLLSV